MHELADSLFGTTTNRINSSMHFLPIKLFSKMLRLQI